MAPFGRKFLRARLKSRSEDKEDDPGKEIQVWVRQEEKTVCGLTKHTTCADVVQALLEDCGTSPEPERIPQMEYCLMERWKGFERALPPLTRILRLWAAWGDEQPFVQFKLVRAGDCVPLCESKPGSKVGDQGPAQYVRSLPVDRQKRMVRKAFRKLEKIREQERAPAGDDGRICGLVQLIISQDHAIREQAHRMRELDLEIERIERGLRPAPESPQPGDDPLAADGLGCLERQLERHADLIERLSRDIDAEMRNACSAGGGEPASEGLGPGAYKDGVEVERVRRDLEHSMYRGLTLHTQLAELERELELNQAVLSSKGQECERLTAQLSGLRVADCAGAAEKGGSASWTEQARSAAAHAELQKVLSHGDGTDTDSDTGISSTHSQDSLSPCGDIRPPLETQV
ncbi:hypothetical protein SKAU_G00047710 [Synaphobranchus kaupii]|uniref:Ras-associating domain-containing protein n=1 Tax=Synaphobranchus kaupii TaxID=118154 RepID=A0A9Q1J8C5_SYNKA|nr:hypothetical protein SKAU_G00047710 [Synaphobranchus kaupii]